jgi:hypothetical protein
MGSLYSVLNVKFHLSLKRALDTEQCVTDKTRYLQKSDKSKISAIVKLTITTADKRHRSGFIRPVEMARGLDTGK